jgi:hypothetical protein
MYCAVGNDIFVFDSIVGKSTYKYDTITDTWSILAPMPITCSQHSASAKGRFIYMVGASNRTWVLRFDPALDLWSELGRTSVMRDLWLGEPCMLRAG